MSGDAKEDDGGLKDGATLEEMNQVTLAPGSVQITKEDEPKQELTRKVTQNGVEYDLPIAVADMIEKSNQSQRNLEDKVAQLQATISTATQNQPKEEVKTETNTKYGDRIFEDPDGVLNDLTNNIVDKVRKMYETEKQYETRVKDEKKQLEQFYDDFFKDNKQFKKDQDKQLVETILNMNYNNWQHLPVNSVKERLAETANQIILGHRASNHTPKEGVVLESGSQPVVKTPPKKADEEEKGPLSLSQTIKNRQAARRKANN